MQQTKNRMPKGYLAMWIAISLAYLIWMVFFMKDIVLVNYATVAERTVDGVLSAVCSVTNGSIRCGSFSPPCVC